VPTQRREQTPTNYRLGALGFLSHPALTTEDKAHPTSGNYGFEDQQAALRWVKDNVGAFGGDASKVTIFGESAGGYSVCAHLIAPDSAGLFQRAISESGICSRLTATTRDAQYSRGEAVARTMGCSDGATLLQCMRGNAADDFVNMMSPPMLPGGLFFQGSGAAQGDAGVADAGAAGAPDAGAAASGPWSPVNDGVVIPANIGTTGAGFARCCRCSARIPTRAACSPRRRSSEASPSRTTASTRRPSRAPSALRRRRSSRNIHHPLSLRRTTR